MKNMPYTTAEFIKDKEYYINAFEEVEKAVMKIEAFDYELLKKIIEKDFQIPLIQNFFPRFNLRTPIYRIRNSKDFQNDKSLIESFGAPPAESAKHLRANIENKPVFYGALLPQTAIIECKVEIGEEIFFSTWKLKEKENIGIRPFLKIDNTMPNIWNKIVDRLIMQLNSKLSTYNFNKTNSIKFIIEKLSNWFLIPDNYTLSSFLGHYFLYDTNLLSYGYSTDCILYPSIAHSLEGVNIACSPNCVSKMELTQIVKGRFNYMDDKGLSLSISDVGIPSENTIIWNDVWHTKYFSHKAKQSLLIIKSN